MGGRSHDPPRSQTMRDVFDRWRMEDVLKGGSVSQAQSKTRESLSVKTKVREALKVERRRWPEERGEGESS
jgi:hypothetical protein